jgi:hypothetical protein
MTFNLAMAWLIAAMQWIFALALLSMSVFPQSAISRWLNRKDSILIQTVENRRACAVMAACFGLLGLYTIGKELSQVTGWLSSYMTWIDARLLLNIGTMITACISLAAVVSLRRKV